MGATTERGARRSDVEVFAEARQPLDASPTVPGTVRVHVEDGTVTLTGSVQHPSHRADAEHTVRPVIGTRHVVNKIVVLEAPRAENFEAS